MARVEMESGLQRQAAGLHDQAVAALENALRIRRARLPETDPLVHRTLGALAFAYQLAFQYPRAVETFEELLGALEARRDDEAVRERVIAANRIAWIHERAALDEKAKAYRERSREIAEVRGGAGGTSPLGPTLGLEGLPPPDPVLRARMREMKRAALAWIEERRFRPEHFALETQLLVSMRRLARGMPTRSVERRLTRALASEFLSFAPARPRSDSDPPYGLPFESGIAHETVRTPEGAHGVRRDFLHAVDFELPPGSAVLAARAGRVVRVVEGFDPTAPAGSAEDDRRHGIRVNRVIVLHDDDTYATYQPLASAVEVDEGERVARGQELGRTARLADGRTPILHFDVRRNALAGSSGVLVPEPVRVRFADVSRAGGAPLAGRASPSPPPAAPAPD
jgi:murein DD-endopeptidase MepM/ murein hydrolase activator NlpD